MKNEKSLFEESVVSSENYFMDIIFPILSIQKIELENIQKLMNFQFNSGNNLAPEQLKQFVINKKFLATDFFQKNQVDLTDLQLTGLDLPIYFNGLLPQGKRIMIVAQDPLRNEEGFIKMNANISHEMIIWTPFSYQEKNNDNYLYWNIIGYISEKSSQVYITDLNKIWFKPNKNNLTIRKDLKANLYLNILEKEVNNYFKPDIIFAFGKKAFNELKFLKTEARVYYILHPSRTAARYRPEYFADFKTDNENLKFDYKNLNDLYKSKINNFINKSE